MPEEKKAMLQEIANQKGVSCRAQGWKVHLCAAQLLQLVGKGGLLASYNAGDHRFERQEAVFTNSVPSHLTLGYHRGAGVSCPKGVGHAFPFLRNVA